MSINVFISHVSDETGIAQALKDVIASDFLGMTEVFVSSDLESILAGETWLKSVADALDRANILLVLCSHQSISRPWINFEAGAAWLKKIPIIPICHSGLELSKLPMPLAVLQGVSLIEPKQLKKLYIQIAKTLGATTLPNRDFDELASKFSALQVLSVDSKETNANNISTDPKAYLSDSALTTAIDHASLGWTLCFIGEDQSDKIVQLTNDLDEGSSEDGNGKRFASGFSYWGIGPTLAWVRACTDPMYLVAKKGIETFPERWEQCAKSLPKSVHYVSLGVGTGHKDRKILRDLLDRDPHTYFFPVDMSGEMLRVGISRCMNNPDLKRSQVLPIQIDFSTIENARSIRGVVTSVVGEAPVLYSLLGNTLANFDDDDDLLQILAGLLRSQDKFLLEVATTNEISEAANIRAATEYRRSESFYTFATSALDQYTSLNIERNCLSFLPNPKLNDCLEVRVIYRNNSESSISMKITTGKQIIIAPNETIRLYLTRKYLKKRIEEMIDSIGCKIDIEGISPSNREGFGSLAVIFSPKV